MASWDDIARMFAEIELGLIASLKRNLAGHKEWEEAEGFDWPAWQALKIRNMEKFTRENRELMSRRSRVINSETEKLMQEEFAQGSGKTEGITDESFFGTNTARNNALIEDILTMEKKAESAALRMMDDVYRQTVYKSHLAMSSGAVTLPQAVDTATKDFLYKGINCIVYADGSRHNIADYVQMALRTAATRSYLQGEAQKRMRQGIDTVIVSQYGACSDTCLPWQGKVYIDDVFMPFEGERRGDEGRSKNGKWYTLLSVAVGAGLLHPNCRHTLRTWIEGINTVPAPLDEEKVRRTAKLEAQQRAMEREIRKWKRLEAGTFDPAQKKAYTEKVKQAQKDLREFIAAHPQELRRDPWREKIYETSPRAQASHEPEFTEKLPKSVENSGESGIMGLKRKMNRKEANIGAFSNLKIPMQKREVLRLCHKYNIDMQGITVKIQRSEKLLSLSFYGSTDYYNIGRIDLFPNAFIDEEQLIRTVIHEKCHVLQLLKFGRKYTQENMELMEKKAERFESIYYKLLSKKVK